MNAPSSLYRFLLRHARGLVLLMLAAGALSGLFSIGVLALINHALSSDGAQPTLLGLAFAALVAGKIVTTLAAQLLLVRFSQGTILELSLTLCEKILRAPLRLLERRGPARVLATLTDDVSAVTWAVQCLPQFAMNAALVAGCALYLAWLSWQLFAAVAAVTVAGALIHKLLHARAFGLIHAAREARSRLFEHFRDLSAGSKELMLHRRRREAFLDEQLRPAAEDYRRSNLAASSRYALAEAWLQALFYGLIGLLLFALPGIARPSPEALTGYVFAMIYMMGPIWSLAGVLPTVARGQVALRQIEALGVDLDGASEEQAERPIHGPAEGDDIELREAVFAYDGDASGKPGFRLGPIDFRLRRGDLIFVAGGNGSGKSTFVKLLCGLYPPQEGSLAIGGQPVARAGLDGYREHFSVVFSDFHLFDKLLGIPTPEFEARLHGYLELLHLGHKVSLRDGGFSTRELSQGQRKRLALITAYLEDRPFYVLDEWAADQDPEYKEVFYTRLLPELRRRGKGVVVITHDDRYFHLGDRVIKLEDGRLVGTGAGGAADRAAAA